MAGKTAVFFFTADGLSGTGFFRIFRSFSFFYMSLK